MAKKKKEETTDKIPVSEIEIGGTYKTYVNDIVKVLKKDEEREQFVVMNITGAHKMWLDFKNIFLVEKIR